jgi:hypothetical protein
VDGAAHCRDEHLRLDGFHEHRVGRRCGPRGIIADDQDDGSLAEHRVLRKLPEKLSPVERRALTHVREDHVRPKIERVFNRFASDGARHPKLRIVQIQQPLINLRRLRIVMNDEYDGWERRKGAPGTDAQCLPGG